MPDSRDIDYSYNPTRRSGRTTRLANIYIELLLLVGEVEIKDHFNSKYAHWRLGGIVRSRLEQEHPEVYKNCDITITHIKRRDI